MKTLTSAMIDHCEPYDTPLSLPGDAASERPSFVGQGLRLGAASIFDQAIVSATNFATTLIIARLCSKEEVGVYYLAWTIILFVVAAQGNLISIPYTIYCCRREGQSLASYAGSTLVHQLAISLAAISAILSLTIVFSLGLGPPAMQSVGWVLLCVSPFILMREYTRRFMFAHLNLAAAIVMDISVSCVQLLSLLLLGYYHLLTIPVVYAVMGGACFCTDYLVFFKWSTDSFSIRPLCRRLAGKLEIRQMGFRQPIDRYVFLYSSLVANSCT